MMAQTPHHLTDEEIIRCVSGQVKEEDLLLVYEHLGQCDKCAERFRRARLHHFDFEQWNASTHVMEIHRHSARMAIEETIAGEKTAQTRRRLVAWLEQWSGIGEVGALLEFDWDTDQDRVRFSICDAISRPHAKLHFSTATRTGGEDRILVEMRWTGASQSSSSPAGLPAPPQTTGENSRTAADAGLVMIDPAKRCLELTFRTIPQGLQMPLVLLYPEARQGKIFLSEPATVPQSPDRLTRFENIPAGQYTLLLSPTVLSLDT